MPPARDPGAHRKGEEQENQVIPGIPSCRCLRRTTSKDRYLELTLSIRHKNTMYGIAVGYPTGTRRRGEEKPLTGITVDSIEERLRHLPIHAGDQLLDVTSACPPFQNDAYVRGLYAILRCPADPIDQPRPSRAPRPVTGYLGTRNPSVAAGPDRTPAAGSPKLAQPPPRGYTTAETRPHRQP